MDHFKILPLATKKHLREGFGIHEGKDFQNIPDEAALEMIIDILIAKVSS